MTWQKEISLQMSGHRDIKDLTAEVARILWELAQSKSHREIFNVCGEGLISPREIAVLAGKKLDLSLLPPETTPRVVDVNIGKLKKFTPVQPSAEVVARFVRESTAAAR